MDQNSQCPMAIRDPLSPDVKGIPTHTIEERRYAFWTIRGYLYPGLPRQNMDTIYQAIGNGSEGALQLFLNAMRLEYVSIARRL